jgi:hypothetical protein
MDRYPSKCRSILRIDYRQKWLDKYVVELSNSRRSFPDLITSVINNWRKMWGNCITAQIKILIFTWIFWMEESPGPPCTANEGRWESTVQPPYFQFPIPTLIFLWEISRIGLSIFQQPKMWTDPGNIYVNRSQAPECVIWGWGHASPKIGIHKWDFRFQCVC